MSANYIIAHVNTRSLTHWARPGIEPTSSWFPFGFIYTTSWWELLNLEGFVHSSHMCQTFSIFLKGKVWKPRSCNHFLPTLFEMIQQNYKSSWQNFNYLQDFVTDHSCTHTHCWVKYKGIFLHYLRSDKLKKFSSRVWGNFSFSPQKKLRSRMGRGHKLKP